MSYGNNKFYADATCFYGPRCYNTLATHGTLRKGCMNLDGVILTLAMIVGVVKYFVLNMED